VINRFTSYSLLYLLRQDRHAHHQPDVRLPGTCWDKYADGPARRAASRAPCCAQTWTLSVINHFTSYSLLHLLRQDRHAHHQPDVRLPGTSTVYNVMRVAVLCFAARDIVTQCISMHCCVLLQRCAGKSSAQHMCEQPLNLQHDKLATS